MSQEKPDLQLLIDDYLALRATIDEVETQLAEAKKEMRGRVSQIFTHYGQGPHLLGGVKCAISIRDGSHYFRQVKE